MQELLILLKMIKNEVNSGLFLNRLKELLGATITRIGNPLRYHKTKKNEPTSQKDSNLVRSNSERLSLETGKIKFYLYIRLDASCHLIKAGDWQKELGKFKSITG
jgi:hypothetical protein